MENSSKEENISKISLNLDELPIDVLICILSYCQLTEFGRLCRVCKRFNNLIANEFLWRQICKSLITNQIASEIILRSSKLLKPKEKCRIATNWRAGFYSENIYLFNIRYMPWLLLEADQLWMSKGNSLYAFPRTKNGVKMEKPLLSLEKGHVEDIRRFIKAHNTIFSCGQDGRICGWSADTGKLLFRKSNCHDSDIHCIDVNQQTLVTGSKDGSVKIWRLREDLTWCDPALTVSVNDRTWCVAIDPTGVRVACGSAGHSGIPPLHFYDLESGLETTILECNTFNKGAAIFDMKWESPSTLITCGYDSFIRTFDIRVGGCVGMWMDPFDAAGYCLATDKVHSILCGTSQYGRVQFWDKRMLLSVQAFFCKGVGASPVYSVTFDPCKMFIAQYWSLNVMDFSEYLHENSQRKDYRTYWGKNNVII